MRFAHISDIHLADKLNFDSSFSKLIRKIKWDSFKEILDKNKDKDFLLISGDLYERDFFTLKDYQVLFDLIEDFSKDVYYLCGNHDYIDDKNKIFFVNKPDNLHIFSSDRIEFFEYKNVRIYGISYKDRIFDKRFNYNLNLNDDFYNILLMHGEFNQSSSNYLSLDLEKIRQMNFSYVGLGHIHKKYDFSNNIFYVGSIEPSSFKDIGEYGYNIVDENQVKFIDSSQMFFEVLDMDLLDYKNMDQVIAYLEDKLRKKYNFLTINLSNYDSFKFDKSRLKSDLSLTYLKVNKVRSKDYYYNLAKTYSSSLLNEFYQSVKDLDMDNPINKRCMEIGFDAILRSKDD